MPAVETTVEITFPDIYAPPSIPEFNNLFTSGTIAKRKRINSTKFEPGQFTCYTLSNRSMAYAFYLAMKADYS